jgi:hypothetical protein
LVCSNKKNLATLDVGRRQKVFAAILGFLTFAGKRRISSQEADAVIADTFCFGPGLPDGLFSNQKSQFG